MKSLADLGIASINLNATTASGRIDGQELLAKGIFTYVNGQTGNYAMVALGQVLQVALPSRSTKFITAASGNPGADVNVSNVPVQADIGSGVATAAALRRRTLPGSTKALSAVPETAADMQPSR